jgi:hypothetical protein
MSGEKIKGRRESNFISKQNRPCCFNCPDKYLSSEKLRNGLANFNRGGNERSHRHRVRRLAFSAAASFGIWAIANLPFGSRQGIRTGGTCCLFLMIRNRNPWRATFTTGGQSQMHWPAFMAL